MCACPPKELVEQFRMARPRLLDNHFAGAQHGIDIGLHASGTDAVRKQEFRDEIEVAALGDIQVELQIFTARGFSGSECRIIASHRFSAAFSNQGCAAREKIAYNQSGVDATPKIALRNIPEHAVLLVDSPRPAIDQLNPIPRSRMTAICFLIFSGCQRSSASMGAMNSPPAWAIPWLRADARPPLRFCSSFVLWSTFRHALDKCCGLICRTVVNNQDF
jgi:hypothetical protein